MNNNNSTHTGHKSIDEKRWKQRKKNSRTRFAYTHNTLNIFICVHEFIATSLCLNDVFSRVFFFREQFCCCQPNFNANRQLNRLKHKKDICFQESHQTLIESKKQTEKAQEVEGMGAVSIHRIDRRVGSAMAMPETDVSHGCFCSVDHITFHLTNNRIAVESS